MQSKSLVVLAAGMGSRYGGLKQMDPVGPGGEFLLDYSVHDALRAGFETVVFVIRRDLEADFRQLVGGRWERRAEVRYVHQRLDDLPGGRHPPSGRTKPWGTGQAVWAARHVLGGPFGVVNADDFYGRAAFQALASALDSSRSTPERHVLVAYDVSRTLSEHGSVSRGVCRIDATGLLAGIREHAEIARGPDGIIRSSEGPLADDTPVSMNLLGFQPSFRERLDAAFEAFLERDGQAATSEFYIPSVVNDLVAGGLATVEVRRAGEDWFGVTYAPDRPGVVRRLEELVRRGVYPGPMGL